MYSTEQTSFKGSEKKKKKIIIINRPIVTDQTIDFNRPDILLINQGEK